MARKIRDSSLQSANITVKAGGQTRMFEIRDIDFSQSRAQAVQNIGSAVIDAIYAATEGKRAEK